MSEDFGSPKRQAKAADNKSKLKSDVAREKLRDEEGHFVHPENLSPAEALAKEDQPTHSPFGKFLSQHTHYDKTQDDLLDVHIGNPLRKITLLLEEIKRQKAFSFTLKGSLGLAGVALTLGVFGIFGGGQILCEKGVQSQIGTVNVLNVTEQDPVVPFISDVLNLISEPSVHNRIVLIKNNETVISLSPTSPIIQKSLTSYNNYSIIATGNYNSCNQNLTINNTNGVEIYTR